MDEERRRTSVTELDIYMQDGGHFFFVVEMPLYNINILHIIVSSMEEFEKRFC